MFQKLDVWLVLALSFVIAGAISFGMTPYAKRFAEKVGAIDLPNEERRVNDHPVPRMGGLAIFLGFIAAVLLFAEVNTPMLGVLIGAVIIVVMGAVDDIVGLNAWVKLLVQVVAAMVAVRCGIVFKVLSNLSIGAENGFFSIGALSAPLTVLWIVGCTNAVNLIDGLDGLAAGVSSISSLTMLVVALFVAEPNVAIVLAALTGACIGFMPFNSNPARIFMGDVGAQFLGFVLATVSVIGLFKFHAIVTFLVPVLAMAVPLADTAFAFFRRIFNGQSPFHADREHLHHRLLALGLDQKQVVAILYAVSAVLGLIAVLLAGQEPLVRIICLAAAFLISLTVWIMIVKTNKNKK